MDTHNASLTLAEIDRATARTRAALRSIWYPLVVYGALTLATGALDGFASATVAAVFLLVGLVAAVIAVNRYYAGRGVDAGGGRAYLRLLVAYVVGSIVAGGIAANLGGEGAALVAQAIVFLAFYLALARLAHSVLLAAIGVGFLVLCGTLALAGPAHEVAIAQFVLGAALVVSGLYARERDAVA
jgi:hypothetical protein